MGKLLLTGATGFVGGAVYRRLLKEGVDARVAGRRSIQGASSFVQVTGLDSKADWSSAVEGIDVVIHSAARVHVMSDKAADPLTEFRKVNVQGTLALARQAVEAGVKRFIFVSTIKVNGEGTELNSPYTADDVPAPVDPYGISKLEAEQGLLAFTAET